MATRGEQEFINLPFQEKLEFLYGLPARRKRDLILSAPEAERLVQSFAPETLFYTLKEIGSADAGDLLSMAVPEQIKSLFDLDCWRKDRPDLDRMREWIEAMAEGGRARLAQALMELDLELVTLLVRQYVRVYRLEEAQAALDVPSRQVVQYDDHYLVEFIRHDNILPTIQEFLEETLERDYDYFTSLMEEIYWGVQAELEEHAYHLRRARLNDRGFPDYYDAQSVFAYLNPVQWDTIRRSYLPPTRDEDSLDQERLPAEMALLAPGSDNSLFNAALMAGFAAQGKRQLRTEMALVTNQVLVARDFDFGDPEAMRVGIEMTHDYLNLGLEHLASGDLTTAIECLRDNHLKLLFRLGVSLTVDLRTRAQELMARLNLASSSNNEISYFDTPYREALGGFLQRIPRFYSGIDGSGGVVMRNFSRMRDLHLAYRVLDELNGAVVLFKSLLGIDLASAAFRAQTAGREVRLSQILLTALVQQALGNELAPLPLPANRLAEVSAVVMDGEERPRTLAKTFRELVDRAVAQSLDEPTARQAKNFIASCLSLLEEEFAELEPKAAIDPRFIQSLLLRAG